MTDNREEPLSVESETSFVILSNGSLHPSIVEEINTNAENLLMSSTNSMTPFKKSDIIEPMKSSFFNGLSNFGNEAQDMINQLLKENLQLKETLSQNNLAIKSHLNNFFIRQQEMLEAQETHKQKFSEMKELILKLKAENSNLKKQLDYYLLKIPNDSVTDANVYSDVKKKTNTLVQGSEQLLKEEQDKCEKLEISKEILTLKNIELQKTVNNLEKEVLKLNEKLEDVERLQQLKSFENRPQEGSFPTFSLPNSEARTQINNLLIQLEDERAKNLKLKQELEREKTNSLIVSQNKSTALELSQCLTKLEEMSVSLEKQTERFNSFNSWISLTEKNFSSAGANDKNDELVPGTNNLKSQLNNEKISSQQNEKIDTLEKMKTDYSKLVDEYKMVQEKIKDFENVTKNARELEEKIENLLQELNRKNQELEVKEKECTDLKEEVQSLQLKCEDISALEVQADVYKNDFQEEREARQKLAGEKELMAEKIRLLQQKIQDLETDKSASSDNSDSPTKTPEKPKKARYVCPKCMFAFSDLKMCEDHVEECIDTFFYPGN